MNKKLYEEIEQSGSGSAWRSGVKAYALELVEGAEVQLTRENAKAALLNGAEDWYEYSWGGCSLIYNGDIAERLCSPSELKKKKGGELNPNRMETWLHVQSRALRQAYSMIRTKL